MKMKETLAQRTFALHSNSLPINCLSFEQKDHQVFVSWDHITTMSSDLHFQFAGEDQDSIKYSKSVIKLLQ